LASLDLFSVPFCPNSRVTEFTATEALERTGGDVRWVQKLSRHASINTPLYDDARRDKQGEITDLLAAGL
jgi:integrase/recombinase XerC